MDFITNVIERFLMRNKDYCRLFIALLIDRWVRGTLYAKNTNIARIY